jgi:hypothetical protein
VRFKSIVGIWQRRKFEWAGGRGGRLSFYKWDGAK